MGDLPFSPAPSILSLVTWKMSHSNASCQRSLMVTGSAEAAISSCLFTPQVIFFLTSLVDLEPVSVSPAAALWPPVLPQVRDKSLVRFLFSPSPILFVQKGHLGECKLMGLNLQLKTLLWLLQPEDKRFPAFAPFHFPATLCCCPQASSQIQGFRRPMSTCPSVLQLSVSHKLFFHLFTWLCRSQQGVPIHG